MRVSAKMESPPVRNDLRFIVGLLPFEVSLTLGNEVALFIAPRSPRGYVVSSSFLYRRTVWLHPLAGGYGAYLLALRFVLASRLDLKNPLYWKLGT